MSSFWTQKHKPRTVSEIVGNSEAIQKFSEWVQSWGKRIPKKRTAFLYGPPGVGKTVVVEALAQDLHMELIEKNASDYRTGDAIKRFAGLASQYHTLTGGKRLILLDELGGIHGNVDRGGVRAITEIAKNTRCPLILIANNVYNPRFRTLRKYCLLLEFKKPTLREIERHLKKICIKEGIKAEEKALRFVATRSGRDVRSAVTDLQTLSQGKKQLVYEDVSWFAQRDRKDAIFSVLQIIFYSHDAWEAKRAVDKADIDFDTLFLWIYENVPYHFSDPHDLRKALDSLSLADIYRRRIRTSQNWSLLRYFLDFMTSGVAVARERTKRSGWIPFRFPERLRWLSRTKAERVLLSEISNKIGKKCHTSSKTATKDFLPYLKIIFGNDIKMAAGAAKWLGLTETMIGYLAGDKRQTREIMTRMS